MKPLKLKDLIVGLASSVGCLLLGWLGLLTNFGFAWVDIILEVIGALLVIIYVIGLVSYLILRYPTSKRKMQAVQPKQLSLRNERREDQSHRRSTGLKDSFSLDAETIDDQVTKTSSGVYALGTKKGNIFHVHYVGRSDVDVKAELKDCVGRYDRFKFDYTDPYSSDAAFLKECQLFHDFGGTEGKLDNQHHPERPSGDVSCPICGDHTQKTIATGPSESSPPKLAKQFCVKCGTTLPLESKFCNKCGTQQP